MAQDGTGDFIFGSSTAWFEECDIYCKGKGSSLVLHWSSVLLSL
ncbi:MAG: hypothetical protein PHG62_03115 [Proteiniphilum sp.]|nr:hypothetical protein [Proteiniphilum sp.]MDD4485689.1 hypothetical protein [Proteiniphilum sp.]